MSALFLDPGALRWAFLLVAAFLAMGVDSFLMKRLVKRFPAAGTPELSARRLLRRGFFGAALVLLLLALMRPVWGKPDSVEVTTRGRDIVFLVDVSRSMLARDLVPDRLGRAKAEILNLIPSLEGDRVALVAWSGKPVIKCPLTTDYGFFRLAVQELGPDAVSTGGTDLASAIRFVTERIFDQKAGFRRDLILITDGGDQESRPDLAAAEAGRKGIRMIIIGMGSETTGSPLPVTDPHSGRESFIEYNGERVLSKMEGDLLRRLAGADPSFRFIPVTSGTIDMTTLYRTLIRTAEKGETGKLSLKQQPERFAWFLLPALLFLFVELVFRFIPLPSSVKRRTRT